jgi:hypothetical protein
MRCCRALGITVGASLGVLAVLVGFGGWRCRKPPESLGAPSAIEPGQRKEGPNDVQHELSVTFERPSGPLTITMTEGRELAAQLQLRINAEGEKLQPPLHEQVGAVTISNGKLHLGAWELEMNSFYHDHPVLSLPLGEQKRYYLAHVTGEPDNWQVRALQDPRFVIYHLRGGDLVVTKQDAYQIAERLQERIEVDGPKLKPPLHEEVAEPEFNFGLLDVMPWTLVPTSLPKHDHVVLVRHRMPRDLHYYTSKVSRDEGEWHVAPLTAAHILPRRQ